MKKLISQVISQVISHSLLCSLVFAASLFIYSNAVADILPYQEARIDVFMKGSKIHNIDKEFAVLSVDGKLKAIGRVSTGAGGTAARRWQIFGIEYYKTSIKFHNAPMPKAINLSKYNVLEQTGTFFHGSDHYNQFDGDAHSKGCIRLMTVNEKGKNVFEDPGLHLLVWQFINPEGYKLGYISGDSSTPRQIKEYLREMREKVTVYTHSESSLKEKPGWKETFARLYDVNLIQSAIEKSEDKEEVVSTRNKKTGEVSKVTKTTKRLIGYSAFDEPLSGTELDVLSQIEAK